MEVTVEKKIIIDATSPVIRIPAEFINQFRRNKNHRKLNATMIYNKPTLFTKETFVILIEEK